MLKTGQQIPLFSLRDHNNELFMIDSLIGSKNMVVYFYPKDDTAGCTAEACSFRDQYEDLMDLGAEVIGISADPPESHKRFREKNRLPFRLLSDPGNKVRKLFGVHGEFFGLIPARVTFVIDSTGTVRHVFNSQFNVRKHVKEATEILKKISN